MVPSLGQYKVHITPRTGVHDSTSLGPATSDPCSFLGLLNVAYDELVCYSNYIKWQWTETSGLRWASQRVHPLPMLDTVETGQTSQLPIISDQLEAGTFSVLLVKALLIARTSLTRPFNHVYSHSPVYLRGSFAVQASDSRVQWT